MRIGVQLLWDRVRAVRVEAVTAFLDVPDALGLGLFSVSGVHFALLQETPYFVASLFGVMTGIFGGVLRDVVCNEIPAVFSPATSLYATCSFAGSWVYP